MSPIKRIEGLTDDQRAVEERAITLVTDELPRLIAEYRQRNPVVVGTDLARELFPDYAVDIESRLKYAAAVQKSAAALADAVFETVIAESDGGSVLFTAGGTGAGKTTSIMRDGMARAAFLGATAIFDSNFNSFGSSKKKVQLALDGGCKVVVIFVHRHPLEAFIQGVLPRAKDQGRTVPIDKHLRMHKDSAEAFLRVQKQFSANPDASFVVLSNTGHEAEVFKADIDYLKAVKYDYEALETAIKEGLDDAYYSQKTISKALYDASR